MQKIFIAYGSGAYLQSLRRISKEAKKLGIFSKVITYTEKDMPPFIKSSPLKAYPNGNGYWIWKPYIIWKTMDEYPNSIVVYADCGCTLRPKMEEWNYWFSIMETYDTITFQYRKEEVYMWEDLEKNRRTTNLEWCKQSFIDYFEPMMGREWLSEQQCMSGVVLACRHSILIKMWMDISLYRQDLLMDSFGADLYNPHPMFRQHRRDQSLCSALSMYWRNQPGNVVKVLPETAESQVDTAAIGATRICRLSNPVPLKTRYIRWLKLKFGDRAYQKWHEKLKDNSFVKRIVLRIEHVGAQEFRN